MYNAIILAGGKSSRMGMDTNKVLLRCAGVPLINYLTEELQKSIANNVILVLGYEAEKIQNIMPKSCDFVIQKEQLGTGDAVKSAVPKLTNTGYTLIVNGDGPYLNFKEINQLFEIAKNYDLILLTQEINSPNNFGRILRDENDNIIKIIEAKDANNLEKKIVECNSGIYVIRTNILKQYIYEIKNQNIQHEFYFTDMIEILANKKLRVSSCTLECDFYNSVNTLTELEILEKKIRTDINFFWLQNGVRIFDTNNTYIDKNCTICKRVQIYPNANVLYNSNVGEDTIIEQNVIIKNCMIGKNCTIGCNSVLTNLIVKDGTIIPPLSNLQNY